MTSTQHPELTELLARQAIDAPAPAPPAPGRARRKQIVAWLSIVVGLTLLVAGIALVGNQATGTTNPLHWPQDGSTRTAWSPKDLEKLVVDDVPSGYRLAPDVVDGFSAVDGRMAAEHEDVAEAKPLLERNLVRGQVRGWKRSDSDVVALAVYQFGNHGQAEEYVDSQLVHPQTGDIELVPAKAPDIRGAHAFSATVAGADGGLAAVVWSRGPYVVILIAAATDHDPADDAGHLAEDQHHRLAKWPWLDETISR
jgi:hypothetical protein